MKLKVKIRIGRHLSSLILTLSPVTRVATHQLIFQTETIPYYMGPVTLKP